LIVNSALAEGPWSDPVFVPEAVGIDPDLVWDGEGTAHLSWKSFHPDLSGIASAPVDLRTGAFLDEPAILWAGTGLPHTEAPHLYRIGGWWYLFVAEGGTERGHVVSVARSRSLRGPYEGAPTNPILTHRSTDDPVQNTGHADLVQTADGGWAIVYLGVRPRGTGHGFHVNGRETFIAGLDWVDGWPVIREDRFVVPAQVHSFTDDFTGEHLHPRWISPGAGPASFTAAVPDGLRLTHGAERDSPALLATRSLDPEWTAELCLDVSRGRARVLVRLDDDHWYGLEADRHSAEVVLHVGPVVGTPTRIPMTGQSQLTVKVHARQRPAPQPWGAHPEPDLVGFALLVEGREVPLGEFDGRYLSTEVAGGFTGRVWGVEVLEGEVTVTSARYGSHTL
ncbi:family 43 glycosylhydrolase, partial [Sinomonas humi]